MSPSSMVRTRSGLYIPRTYDELVRTESSVLRAYWFDEASGNLLDHIGSSDGTPVNSPTRAGVNGYTFNGTTQRVTLPTTGAIPTGNSKYSIEFVAKPSSVSGQHDVGGLGSSTTNQATMVGFTGTSFWNYWNGSNVTSTGVTIATNAWWHCVATYDQANLVLYVNGVQRGTAARSAHAGTATVAVIGMSAVTTAFFAGSIRRFAWYNDALSASRVAAHAAVAPL